MQKLNRHGCDFYNYSIRWPTRTNGAADGTPPRRRNSTSYPGGSKFEFDGSVASRRSPSRWSMALSTGVQAVGRRGLPDEEEFVDRPRVRRPDCEPVAVAHRVGSLLDGRPWPLEQVRGPVCLDAEVVHAAGGVRATGHHPAV
jgi:hypothetical protein